MRVNTYAAIYLRISEDRAGEEKAVERQREDAHEIARERGWTIVGEYVDNSISASKVNITRPEYERLVADYAAGKVQAIICYDLDRLTRQPRQLEDWIDAAEQRGLSLVTMNGEADLGTDAGRLFARIKAAVARAEVERKGARHRRANRQRIESGLPVPGRRRYGYLDGNLEPHPVEAPVVRRCFDEIAAGTSLRGLAKMLLAEETPVGNGKGWNTVRLRAMLLNPSYGGLVRSNGVVYPGSDRITALVSPELAEEVRAILTDEARRTTTGPGRRHLLSGIAFCGIEGCARTLTLHSHYYTCKLPTNAKNEDVTLDPRKHVGIKLELLDARVREAVALALLTTPRDVLTGPEDTALAPLVAQLAKNERQASAVVADRDEELISPAAARARLIELRDARKEIEAKIDTARAARTSSATLGDLARELLPLGPIYPRDLVEAVPRVAARFAELDIDRQRDAIRQLVDVVVNPGRGAGRVIVWHKVAEHLNPELSQLDTAEEDAA